MAETTYRIIRFRLHGDSTVIGTGLTLAEAQAHCKDSATHDSEAEDPRLWSSTPTTPFMY